MRSKEWETVAAAVRVSLILKMNFLIEQRVFIVKEYVQSKSIQSVYGSFRETGRLFVRHPTLRAFLATVNYFLLFLVDIY